MCMALFFIPYHLYWVEVWNWPLQKVNFFWSHSVLDSLLHHPTSKEFWYTWEFIFLNISLIGRQKYLTVLLWSFNMLFSKLHAYSNGFFLVSSGFLSIDMLLHQCYIYCRFMNTDVSQFHRWLQIFDCHWGLFLCALGVILTGCPLDYCTSSTVLMYVHL